MCAPRIVVPVLDGANRLPFECLMCVVDRHSELTARAEDRPDRAEAARSCRLQRDRDSAPAASEGPAAPAPFISNQLASPDEHSEGIVDLLREQARMPSRDRSDRGRLSHPRTGADDELSVPDRG